jgi:hypothetical protein
MEHVALFMAHLTPRVKEGGNARTAVALRVAEGNPVSNGTTITKGDTYAQTSPYKLGVGRRATDTAV